jgi:hypothetical protein
MAEVHLRTMIPARHQRWPVWELSLDQEIIGWIYEIHIRGTIDPFYRAVGVHRATGRHIELERSTDREERIEVVHQFWLDPMSRPQHLPRELRDR